MMGGIDLIQDLGLVMLVAAAAGWLCQRIGLPVVIGYLGAGVLMSPHTHSFGLISDVGRIQALAQVGLVFLIFSIGQGLTLQRLKRVGLPLIFGTLLIAVFVWTGCRWLGTILGWPSEHSLVLAAILMVSSTAVLGKSLREAKQTHTIFGQTALTITALDDLVAVVMLIVLTSMIQTGAADTSAVFGTILRLQAVIVSILVVSLLLIPPLLNRANRASREAGTLIIVGTLLCMALLSAKAGFSAALGAFLLGMIVSTTAKNDQVGRALGALSDVFGPVFFIAMGMLLDLQAVLEAWPLVLGILAIALVLRIIAATTALLMVGHSMADASRAAVCLTPIGEFSLILALTGVLGGIVPESFYAIAVGVCLFSAVTTPVLIRHSRRMSESIEARQPQFLTQFIGLYHEWIENLKQRQNASLLWRLTAPRVVQVAILVLFVSGLLTFVSPVYLWTEKWLGPDWPLARALPIIFWLLFLALILAPLVAIWRQVEALSMICAEAAIKARSGRALLRPVFEKLLRSVVLTAILVWFVSLIPYQALSGKGLLFLAAGGAIGAAIYWRQLIRLHSRFEIELRTQLSESPFVSDKPQLPGWPKRNGHWKMSLAEISLTENAQARGIKIEGLPVRAQFGCTIVRIDRQGVELPNPGPETTLFPNDKLLLLGTEQNLRSAEEWLNRPKDDTQPSTATLSELSLGHLRVPSSSRLIGRTLGELGIRSQFGIQVVGIERGSTSVFGPGPKENLAPGDQLLVLGTPEQVSNMALWLSN
jgi:CPA2 family monovalent cation:H+ antiporter-2